jgi:hypothetical protein
VAWKEYKGCFPRSDSGNGVNTTYTLDDQVCSAQPYFTPDEDCAAQAIKDYGLCDGQKSKTYSNGNDEVRDEGFYRNAGISQRSHESSWTESSFVGSFVYLTCPINPLLLKIHNWTLVDLTLIVLSVYSFFSRLGLRRSIGDVGKIFIFREIYRFILLVLVLPTRTDRMTPGVINMHLRGFQ